MTLSQTVAIMQRKEIDKYTGKWDGVLGSGGVEKGGYYYNVLELRYMVQAD